MDLLILLYKELVNPLINMVWLVLVACAFWNISYCFYPALLLLLLTIGTQIYGIANSNLKIRLVDLAIILVIILEIVNYFFSTYQPNTFLFLSRLGVVVMLYTSFNLIGDARLRSQLIVYLSAFGTLLGLMTFFFFMKFRSDILKEGFFDFFNLKHLYAPFGQLSNDWSILLLIFLAFIILEYLQVNLFANKRKWWLSIGMLFILFSIFVSFSRGIYLALAIFIILTFGLSIYTKILTFRQALLKLSLLMLAVTCLSLMIGKPVFLTFKPEQSRSQQRSVSGRVALWKNTGKVIARYPLTGIGSGNFSLYYPAFSGKNADAAFTTRVNNTFVQLLLEKGIFGFAAYTFLLATLCYTLIRQLLIKKLSNRKKTTAVVLLSILLAFTVKELTFSSLFENGSLLMLFIILCLLIRPMSGTIISCSEYPGLVKVLPATFCLLASYMAFYYFGIKQADQMNTAGVTDSSYGQYSKATGILDSAVRSDPRQAIYFVHHAVALQNEFVSRETEDTTRKSSLMANYTTTLPELLTEQMIRDYQNALQLNPQDNRAHYNLGWLYIQTRQQRKALCHFERATQLDPAEEIYWLSLGMYYDEQSLTKDADQCYVEALIQAPGIIFSIFWRRLTALNPDRATKLKKKAILQLSPASATNPIVKAKYACLLIEYYPEEAKRLLEEANSELPNLSRASANLAFVLIKEKEVKKAIQWIKRAALLDNNDYYPFLLLADCMEKAAFHEKAITYYSRALHNQVNARSRYDKRIGKSYEVSASMQTCQPIKLWEEVNFQYAIHDLCTKLAELHHITFNESLSETYQKLSQKKTLVKHDLDI